MVLGNLEEPGRLMRVFTYSGGLAIRNLRGLAIRNLRR
ncbi:hypothetical protein DFAR_2040017 [Desulfarculales bacterium]